MNRFTPGFYPPDGPRALYDLRTGQHRHGVGSFTNHHWLARQTDGTIAQIGSGDINVSDMEKIIHDLMPGEAWVIFPEGSQQIANQNPTLYDDLRFLRARPIRTDVERYAFIILEPGIGTVLTDTAYRVTSEVFQNCHRSQIRAILHGLKIH